MQFVSMAFLLITIILSNFIGKCDSNISDTTIKQEVVTTSPGVLVSSNIGNVVNIINDKNEDDSSISKNNKTIDLGETDAGQINKSRTLNSTTRSTTGLGNSNGSQWTSGEVVDEEPDLSQYLYHDFDSDPVIDYEPQRHGANKNRPTFLFGPNQPARIVEFYAPWCPHCRHFRHHYVQFARQVTAILHELRASKAEDFDTNFIKTTNHFNNIGNNHQSSSNITTLRVFSDSNHSDLQTSFTSSTNDTEVKFYAVSCTLNKNLCHQFNVHAFPKIKLFPAGTTNYTDEVPYFKLHPFDVLAALNIQVDHLRLDTTVLANMTFLGGNNNSNKNKGNNSHYIGATDIGYVNDNDHGLKAPWPIRKKTDVFNDAYASLEFNLRNGIFGDGGDVGLSNVTANVFHNWLELVQRTVPVAWKPVQTVVKAILKDFDKAISSESNLLEILDRAVSDFEVDRSNLTTNVIAKQRATRPNKKLKWSASCTKRGNVVDSGLGYTCGLWALFHIISVGIVEYNSMISAADDEVLYQMQISTVHAGETLRNFIQHFFACDVCRMNFLSSYDACNFDHCNRFTDEIFGFDQWMQFPVWLFEVHNSVNVRLLHEGADRINQENIDNNYMNNNNKDTKVIHITPTDDINKHWPSRKDCPICWTESGGHHDEAVYKYLRLEYWPEDAISTAYRQEIVESQQKRQQIQQQSGLEPKNNDMNQKWYKSHRYVADYYENSDNSTYRKHSMWMLSLRQLFQFTPLGLIFGAALSWYVKKQQKKRTGRHKKVDSSEKRRRKEIRTKLTLFPTIQTKSRSGHWL